MSWPVLRPDGLLAWKSLDGTAVTTDHEHKPATRVMVVDLERWAVTFCKRCGAIHHQERLADV